MAQVQCLLQSRPRRHGGGGGLARARPSTFSCLERASAIARAQGGRYARRASILAACLVDLGLAKRGWASGVQRPARAPAMQARVPRGPPAPLSLSMSACLREARRVGRDRAFLENIKRKLFLKRRGPMRIPYVLGSHTRLALRPRPYLKPSASAGKGLARISTYG